MRSRSFALLSLLVVGCFECFGFPVKCVEASWLLELGFYCFSNYSCYFGHEFCYFGCPKPIIWQAWCLHFTTLGTILSAWGHPGGPWEQQEGHVGVRSKIFSDFGLILGPHFESFLSSDGLNSVFFWSLFPGHFLHRFLMELLTAGALKTRFSLGRYCKNHVFAKIVYW